MSNEELFAMLVERSDEEYNRFIDSVDYMYNKMKDTVGYNEQLFFSIVAESYRQAGFDPQIALVFLNLARKHIKELLAKEDNNG